MIPSWFSSRRLIASVSSVLSPSESSDLTVARESRIRITTFSPSAAGRVETRRSMGCPFTATRAPILGPQPVGDVELRHDLDTGDQGDPGRARDLHHLPQHAVDPVADGDPALFRLDVDVARAGQNPLGDDQVHEPDHRTLARLLR